LLNLEDYKVLPIIRIDYKEWLLYKHYAKRIPSISYAYGLYNRDSLVGVCTFGSPPSHALCIGICGEKYKRLVLELNRLCLEHNKKNEASYFVSRCLKMIPKPRIIVSYSDTSKNHHGYVYQACNFIYTGLSAKRTERFDIDNPNRHSKSVIETTDDYQSLAVRDRPQKHRYVYFLGNKTQKKELLNCLNYSILPYPKGDNCNYNASYVPKKQQLLFI